MIPFEAVRVPNEYRPGRPNVNDGRDSIAPSVTRYATTRTAVDAHSSLPLLLATSSTIFVNN